MTSSSLALAMLAVHTPDGLRRAVATEDLAALKRVPGRAKPKEFETFDQQDFSL